LKIQDLKQISICDLLQITALKDEFFICSPLHEEKTPSFKINVKKNIWYDHSMRIGGTNLDLVMRLKNCDISEARNFSFHSQKKTWNNTSTKNLQEIKKIQDLENLALIQYLKERNINIELAKPFLKEIYYSQNDKNYFALAFENDKGGYETRNKFFKGCIGSKNITTIKGSNNSIISIFEGFMDFLSAITYYKKIPKNDVIILNSVAMIETIDLSNYKNICLYLDNDKKGIETTKKMLEKYKNSKDFSKIYSNFKDFNDFIQNI